MKVGIILCLAVGALGAPAGDKISALPGLQFQLNFDQYAGYIDVDNYNNYFYWFVESQNAAAYHPLVVWLNGGPGCSSLIGLFTENGPYRLDYDGERVWENVYSWNKFANILYLESPGGVGFSQNQGDLTTNDNKTADLNLKALRKWFDMFPEFNGTELFLTGESYGGYYVPMLATRVLEDTTFPATLTGIAVGNAFLDPETIMDSYPNFLFYHAMVGENQWRDLVHDCCNNSAFCDFSKYYLNHTMDYADEKCANMTYAASMVPSGIDGYNIYYSCLAHTNYLDGQFPSSVHRPQDHPLIRAQIHEGLGHALGADPSYWRSWEHCHNPSLMNGTLDYLNRLDVRSAIHVQGKVPWLPCNPDFTRPKDPLYKSNRPNMFTELDALVHAKIRVLFYSGDVDSKVNFISTELFIRKFWELSSFIIPHEGGVRKTWHYRNDVENLAGWQTHYIPGFDFVTVKGAGHFVPAYKPAQSLQMFANYLLQKDFDTDVHLSITPQPLINGTTAASTVSLKITEGVKEFASKNKEQIRSDAGHTDTTMTPMMTTMPPFTPPSCGHGAEVGLGVTLAIVILIAAALGFLLYREKKGGYGGYIN